MTPSLKGWPTEAKEAPSPHEVRLTPLDTNPVFNVSGTCWRLEASSRLFCNFIKMTIQQDLVIFNSGHLPFLIVPYSCFQKNGTLES